MTATEDAGWAERWHFEQRFRLGSAQSSPTAAQRAFPRHSVNSHGCVFDSWRAAPEAWGPVLRSEMVPLAIAVAVIIGLHCGLVGGQMDVEAAQSCPRRDLTARSASFPSPIGSEFSVGLQG